MSLVIVKDSDGNTSASKADGSGYSWTGPVAITVESNGDTLIDGGGRSPVFWQKSDVTSIDGVAVSGTLSGYRAQLIAVFPDASSTVGGGGLDAAGVRATTLTGFTTPDDYDPGDAAKQVTAADTVLSFFVKAWAAIMWIVRRVLKIGGTDFYVTDYGADPNSNSDDTQAIIDCLQACFDAGGGRIIFPMPRNDSGYHYYVDGPLITSYEGVNPNCQIPIPLGRITDTFGNGRAKFRRIELVGEVAPNFATGGGPGEPRNDNGVIIESRIQGTGTAPAVFGTPYASAGSVGNRNYIALTMKDMIVRTATQDGSGNDIDGTMTAINMERMARFNPDRVKADVSSNLTGRVFPSNTTYGIIFPDQTNNSDMLCGHIWVEGYKYGVVPGEHFSCPWLALVDNYVGILLLQNHHTINVGLLTTELNAIDMKDVGRSSVTITTWEGEKYPGADKWYQNQMQLWAAGGNSDISIFNCQLGISGGGYGPFVVYPAGAAANLRIFNGNSRTEWARQYQQYQKIFTDIDDWGIGGSVSVGAQSSMQKVRLNATSADAVLYKSIFFTPGDVLRITVEEVINTIGAIQLIVGNSSIVTPGTYELHNLADGTNSFVINTAGFTQSYIQFYNPSGNDGWVRSVKVEKM